MSLTVQVRESLESEIAHLELEAKRCDEAIQKLRAMLESDLKPCDEHRPEPSAQREPQEREPA